MARIAGRDPGEGGEAQAILRGPHCPLPACRGSYILVLMLAGEASIPVLGGVRLEPGVYAYVGSALGPGGLAARLRRHLEGPRRLHWHVDWLRSRSEPAGYAYCCTSARVEDRVADACASTLESGPRGFGASDSRALTHLFRCPSPGSCLRAAEDCLARACGHVASCGAP